MLNLLGMITVYLHDQDAVIVDVVNYTPCYEKPSVAIALKSGLDLLLPRTC